MRRNHFQAVKRGRPPLKPLRIAIDAGCLGVMDERLKVGVYTVAFNLLRELAHFDKKNTYFLYSFYPIAEDNMAQFGSNMHNIVLPRLGWFRFFLPLAIRFHKPDLFLALSQAIPPITTPTIGFIYDLAFVHYPQGYPDSFKKLQKNSHDLIQKATKFITISEDSKQDLVKRYKVPEKKISVAYPGVASVFNPQGPRYISTSPYFLSVGALKKTKNIPLLISAFAAFLKEVGEPYKLILVGSDFWMDKDISETIKKCGIEENVIFKGYVKATDLPALYRGAKACIVSSRYEGFGLPVLEAMASGIPIIVSKLPAIEEIVGDTGILIPSESQKGFTAAMIQVVGDHKMIQRLSKRALIRAHKFSWRMFAHKVLKEIKALS